MRVRLLLRCSVWSTIPDINASLSIVSLECHMLLFIDFLFFCVTCAQPKSVLKCRKSEFDGYLEDEEILNSETAEDSSHSNNADMFETNVSDIA